VKFKGLTWPEGVGDVSRVNNKSPDDGENRPFYIQFQVRKEIWIKQILIQK
jgi:hypothetical protein